MRFKISSGLKSIIGKDLITDDFVAIFELVKNSFDAYAKSVDIYFEKNDLYIIDDGKGMSKDDLINKWLFVAYSAKSDASENKNLDDDYRSNLRAKRNTFAGNKGVGRFSCDRLGKELSIYSKKYSEENINVLHVNWGKFEDDQAIEFGNIEVDYKVTKKFELPRDLKKDPKHIGTVLHIKNLRSPESWNREKLLKLRSSIAKLIDPFGIRSDFDVTLHAPEERIEDCKSISEQAEINDNLDSDSPYNNIVNGKIKNLVFEKLSQKTTEIKTHLSEDQKYIITELVDRGETVYKIREPNDYDELTEVDLSVSLFYMNTKAKMNFTKSMGVSCVAFGSIFLFNNGFRVYPIGEPNDDTLGLNTRKAQGHSRFLGTREVLGLIDVTGSSEKFKETSSRDQGLIKTNAYTQLHTFFMEKSLKRLESYVVNVSWTDKLDSDTDDLSRILTDQGKGKVVKVLSKLVSGKNIELLNYSDRLIDVISERSTRFSETIESLKALTKKINNEELSSKIAQAEQRYQELKEAEEESRKIAEEERLARHEAEQVAFEEIEARTKAESKLQVVETALEEERKSNLFLRKVTSLDVKSVLEFHHQIGIYSSNLKHLINLKIDNIRHSNSVTVDEFKNLLEQVSLLNQQILTISRIATVADYRVSAEKIDEDLIEFSKEYLTNVASDYHQINVTWISDGNPWPTNFRPLDMMIVIENLVHNASKPSARASKITFSSYIENKNRLIIDVFDDGQGFAPHLRENISSIFEMGVSTTDGSGLGLHHVKQVINEMGGSIEANLDYQKGAKLTIRFAK